MHTMTSTPSSSIIAHGATYDQNPAAFAASSVSLMKYISHPIAGSGACTTFSPVSRP